MQQWYVIINGMYIVYTEKKDLENQDVCVNFMHCRETANYLFWPERKDISWVPLNHKFQDILHQ